MFGQRVIAGMFEVIGRDVRGPVVFGAVDELRAQAGQHLSVGQLDGRCTNGTHHVRHQLRLLDANLEALHVLRRADRADIVVDRARAGIVEGQSDETIRLEARQDFLADRAVENLMEVIDRAKQEGHGQRIDRRHQDTDQRDIGAIEINRADAGLL